MPGRPTVGEAYDAGELENGAAGLQAYDAPTVATGERFIICWHEFAVL